MTESRRSMELDRSWVVSAAPFRSLSDSVLGLPGVSFLCFARERSRPAPGTLEDPSSDGVAPYWRALSTASSIFGERAYSRPSLAATRALETRQSDPPFEQSSCAFFLSRLLVVPGSILTE